MNGSYIKSIPVQISEASLCTSNWQSARKQPAFLILPICFNVLFVSYSVHKRIVSPFNLSNVLI